MTSFTRALLIATLCFGIAGPATAKSKTPKLPWDSAVAALTATISDVQKTGVNGIKGHVGDLEQALAETQKDFNSTFESSRTVYVLTDGMADTMIAMAAVEVAYGDKRKKPKIEAIATPYPSISLFLGSYYNQKGRHDDALRVLDAGLAIPGVMDLGDGGVGESIPLLRSERGAALIALKKWPEALANYDKGLENDGLDPKLHALLLRGRGFALIELKQLDDAEAAYTESLTLDSDSKTALQEMEYIKKQRAGAPAAPTGIILPNAPAPAAQDEKN